MCSPSSCSHTEPLQEVCHVEGYRHTSSAQPTNTELWVWWEFFCRHQNIYSEGCICSWEWSAADVLINERVYMQDRLALFWGRGSYFFFSHTNSTTALNGFTQIIFYLAGVKGEGKTYTWPVLHKLLKKTNNKKKQICDFIHFTRFLFWFSA